MNKLLKLSETHYIVVDDSEIKEGDKFYCITNKVIFTAHTIEYLEEYNKLEDSNHNFYVNSKYAQKITHSTQPELLGTGWMQSVLPLFLSEVEEAIYGYSVDKMADKLISCSDNIDSQLIKEVWKGGFKAHKELVKDKLFTIDDMKLCYMQGWNQGRENRSTEMSNYIQSRLPKTEWECTINEQGKIKLI
jgi:hypothetical protein